MDWVRIFAEIFIILAAAVVLGIGGWLTGSFRGLRRRQSKQAAAVDARLDRIEKGIVKIEDLDRHAVIDRVGALERSLAALGERCLKSGDLDRVHQRVDKLTTEVHSMAGKLDSLDKLDKSVGRIHDYLLSRGEGK